APGQRLARLDADEVPARLRHRDAPALDAARLGALTTERDDVGPRVAPQLGGLLVLHEQPQLDLALGDGDTRAEPGERQQRMHLDVECTVRPAEANDLHG